MDALIPLAVQHLGSTAYGIVILLQLGYRCISTGPKAEIIAKYIRLQ